MPQPTWSVQNAKTRLSAVVEAARREPQIITKHGKPAVVVIDAAEYSRLKRLEKVEAPRFNDHLLALPTDDGDFERIYGSLRETGL